MADQLSELSLEQIKEKIRDIFIWPLSLEKLNKLKDNKFELANLDEILFFSDMEFADKGIDKFREDLTLRENVKLCCLWNGYSGLVEASRVKDPYPDIAGTIKIGFTAIESCATIFVDGRRKPYDFQARIPVYFTNFREGYKGLPVKETDRILNNSQKS